MSKRGVGPRSPSLPAAQRAVGRLQQYRLPELRRMQYYNYASGAALAAPMTDPENKSAPQNPLSSSLFVDAAQTALFIHMPDYHSSTPQRKLEMLAGAWFADEHAYLVASDVAVRQFLIRLEAYYRIGAPLVSYSHVLDVFSNIEDIRDVTAALLYSALSRIPGGGAPPPAPDSEVSATVTLQAPAVAAAVKVAGAQKIYGDSAFYSSDSKYTPDDFEKVVGVIIGICEAFLEVGEEFSVYALFCSNYIRSQLQLEKLIENVPALADFVDVQEVCEGISLAALLGLPLIRAAQYVSWVAEVLSVSQELSITHPAIEQVHNFLTIFLREIQDVRFNIEARMRVAAVQEVLFRGQINLISSHRYLIRQGVLVKEFNNTTMKLSQFRSYVFFLFNDVLMYCTAGDTYKVKNLIPLIKLTVEDLPDSGKRKHAFRLQPFAGSGKSVTVLASSTESRIVWTTAIKQAVQKFTKDIETSPIEPSDIEFLIMKTKKKRPRTKDGWSEVQTDMGISYYYQIKSGFTSLGIEDPNFSIAADDEEDSADEGIKLKKPSEGASKEADLPEMRSTILFHRCEFGDCTSRALTAGDGRFCAMHSRLSVASAPEKQLKLVEQAALQMTLETTEAATKAITSVFVPKAPEKSKPLKGALSSTLVPGLEDLELKGSDLQATLARAIPHPPPKAGTIKPPLPATPKVAPYDSKAPAPELTSIESKAPVSEDTKAPLLSPKGQTSGFRLPPVDSSRAVSLAKSPVGVLPLSVDIDPGTIPSAMVSPSKRPPPPGRPTLAALEAADVPPPSIPPPRPPPRDPSFKPTRAPVPPPPLTVSGLPTTAPAVPEVKAAPKVPAPSRGIALPVPIPVPGAGVQPMPVALPKKALPPRTDSLPPPPPPLDIEENPDGPDVPPSPDTGMSVPINVPTVKMGSPDPIDEDVPPPPPPEDFGPRRQSSFSTLDGVDDAEVPDPIGAAQEEESPEALFQKAQFDEGERIQRAVSVSTVRTPKFEPLSEVLAPKPTDSPKDSSKDIKKAKENAEFTAAASSTVKAALAKRRARLAELQQTMDKDGNTMVVTSKSGKSEEKSIETGVSVPIESQKMVPIRGGRATERLSQAAKRVSGTAGRSAMIQAAAARAIIAATSSAEYEEIKEVAEPQKVVWVKVMSEEYGVPYYWNQETQQSTWVKPLDYVEPDP